MKGENPSFEKPPSPHESGVHFCDMAYSCAIDTTPVMRSVRLKSSDEELAWQCHDGCPVMRLCRH
jgi:hypothetical protein